MKDIKASVSITTYNHEKYIAQAIDSVLMQITDFKFEIIVGEDDSSDKTRVIVKEYADKYPDKIRAFFNRREDVIYVDNIATGRRNIINNISNSKGQYIALLDGDDYWNSPYKLQTQVDFLDNNPDFNICFHNAIVINTVNDKKEEVHNYSDFRWCNLDRSRSEYDMIDLLKSPLCPTGSIVFRVPENLNFPEWFLKVPSADIPLLTIVCGDGKIKYIDQFWTTYRKHAEGLTIHHKGDFIHKGRILTYLGLLTSLDNKYHKTIKDMIRHHMTQLNKFDLLPKKDLSYLIGLFPIYAPIMILKSKLLSRLNN